MTGDDVDGDRFGLPHGYDASVNGGGVAIVGVDAGTPDAAAEGASDGQLEGLADSIAVTDEVGWGGDRRR